MKLNICLISVVALAAAATTCAQAPAADMPQNRSSRMDTTKHWHQLGTTRSVSLSSTATPSSPIPPTRSVPLRPIRPSASLAVVSHARTVT